ncbi:MAG: EVE domain-containing protein [Flammeovirgaceae bacterium]|nr:MAG: EVE domain-containing protein [Flammeovirgaceae bacterium]
MNYWLVKTEPETFSWDDLVSDKKTTWDGVRNFRARSNLKKMAKGDLVFIYHTGDEKAIIGLAKVTREAFPDPHDPNWAAVELAPQKKLKRPVTLAEVKSNKRLTAMALVRIARLSVQPVSPEEYDEVLKMSETK